MGEYELKKFEEKLEEQVEKFLRQIASECREGFEYEREIEKVYTSGFPIFGLADEKYYQSKQQEAILEWRVRDELVNEVFDYLFKTHGYDIRWSRKDCCQTFGEYRNEEYEKQFPVEFFIVKNGKYIAYRYSAFITDYSIPENLPKHFYLSYYQTGVKKIEKWYQIVWTETGDEWSEEKFQNRITIESLFLEYFSEEEFKLYIDKMRDAVASANMLMGFQTIPKLVSNNLAIFKEKIVNELPVLNELKYKEITEKGSVTSKDVQILLNDDDTKVLHRNFKSRGGKFALIGKEKFAQSFITSEYLYRIFKEENVFDYTAVVCGYIKSIEQLCECIIFNVIPKIGLKIYYPVGYLNPSEITELCDLKELKKEKQWKVLMKEGNQKYFCKSLTMNQMFHFFEDNQEEIFELKSADGVKHMLMCMENYCNFDRNGYLHKHNIIESEVVERIKNNTLVICYWLLGAIRMTGNLSTDKRALGIIDFSFDKLFKKIAYRNRYKYLLDLGDGVVRKVIRNFSTPRYFFDQNGILQDAELIFLEVEEYPADFVRYRLYLNECADFINKIVVNRKHVPKKIWWFKEDGSKEIIYNGE